MPLLAGDEMVSSQAGVCMIRFAGRPEGMRVGGIDRMEATSIEPGRCLLGMPNRSGIDRCHLTLESVSRFR